MDLSVAYIKSEEKFALKNFKDNAPAPLLNIEELKKSSFQMLIYPDGLNESETILNAIKDINRSIPIKSDKDLGFDFESFNTVDSEQMDPIVKRSYESWVLNNNIELIHNLFETLKHMKNLYPNDRTAFFEELWFTLKRNIGPGNLRLIFNDVKKAKKENAKDELIQVSIEGDKLPNPKEGGEFEASLMKEYNKYFANNFEIVEYSKDSNQLTFTALINQSPVIVMATPFTFSKLQASILKALIEGLGSNV